MYDINDYQESNNSISQESYNGYWAVSTNKWVNYSATWIKRVIQWYAWKFIFLGIFILAMILMGLSQKDAYKTADEMSDHAASDGWFKAFDQFKKETSFKSTKANSHPLYKAPIITSWEQETGLKFNDLYQYIVIKNRDGYKEDLLVLKKPAFDIEDKEKKTLVLEYSTMVTDDAEDICNEYFGDIPTNYQKSFYDRKRHWSIKKIKNEITQENDNEGQFRCVINDETIQDLIKD